MANFKNKMFIQRLSAGLIQDNNMHFASLSYIDDEPRNRIEGDSIDVGLSVAKLPLVTDNNNELARRMSTIPFPCEIELHLKTSISGGKTSLICYDFTPLPQK